MKTYNILVVDDNADNAEKIIDFLNETEKEFMFFQALNGKVACTVAEKKLPDLIITDWKMPLMDGVELIKHLKSIESTHDIPVIMCTGVMTDVENLKTALDSGAVDYIRKPVEKLELIARVNSMLKLSDSMKKVKEQNHDLWLQKEEILKHEKEIESQNEKLTELNATKDKIFSIIAHDLKSPFTSIFGFADMLIANIEGYDTGNIVQYLNNISGSAKNAYKLLENLLDWARSQTGNIQFKPENINLESLIIGIYDITSSSSFSKKIKVSFDINSEIEVLADSNMLNTILRNLVTNAIKYTHKGGNIKIDAATNANHVTISVIDNGIGIKPEKIAKIFDISDKSSLPGTEGERGTGLGLLLCKEFVEKHGGRIWVESEEQKGSKFHFTLPLSPKI